MRWLIELLIKLLGGNPNPPAPPIKPPVDPIQVTELHRQLLQYANDARMTKGVGLSAWQPDSLLDSLAQAQAEYCAKLQRLDHKDASGQWPDQRARDAGYEGQQVSEILAAWQRSPYEAIESWLASTVGHRQILLSATYNEVGRGVAVDNQGRYYWCLMPGKGIVDGWQGMQIPSDEGYIL